MNAKYSYGDLNTRRRRVLWDQDWETPVLRTYSDPWQWGLYWAPFVLPPVDDDNEANTGSIQAGNKRQRWCKLNCHFKPCQSNRHFCIYIIITGGYLTTSKLVCAEWTENVFGTFSTNLTDMMCAWYSPLYFTSLFIQIFKDPYFEKGLKKYINAGGGGRA